MSIRKMNMERGGRLTFISQDLRDKIDGRKLANPRGGRGVPPPANTGYRRKLGPKECSVCSGFW